MSLCSSLRICWLPRRIFLRSLADESSSEYRSASRFSLKIARFAFLKDRMNTKSTITTFVASSTYAHYTKRETDDDIQDLARNFLLSLEPGGVHLFFSPSTDFRFSRSATNSARRTNRSGENRQYRDEFCHYSSISISDWYRKCFLLFFTFPWSII